SFEGQFLLQSDAAEAMELADRDLDGNGPISGDDLTRQLNDVDESALGYVADFQYPDPKKWRELAIRRQKMSGSGQAKDGAEGKPGGKGAGMNRPGQSAGGPGTGVVLSGGIPADRLVLDEEVARASFEFAPYADVTNSALFDTRTGKRFNSGWAMWYGL